jgi:hypothetical protein
MRAAVTVISVSELPVPDISRLGVSTVSARAAKQMTPVNRAPAIARCVTHECIFLELPRYEIQHKSAYERETLLV